MRRTLACACAALAALTIVPTANAHKQTTIDVDETPGPLDIVYARLRHPEGRIAVRIGTYEAWDDGVLERSQTNERRFVAVEFDTRQDDGAQVERRVVVTTEGGELVARMYGPGGGDPMEEPLAEVDVRRPEGHSVNVSFPARLLGRKTTSYEWWAVTSFEAPGDADCPKPEGPYDGGYGQCSDFTAAAREKNPR